MYFLRFQSENNAYFTCYNILRNQISNRNFSKKSETLACYISVIIYAYQVQQPPWYAIYCPTLGVNNKILSEFNFSLMFTLDGCNDKPKCFTQCSHHRFGKYAHMHIIHQSHYKEYYPFLIHISCWLATLPLIHTHTRTNTCSEWDRQTHARCVYC